MSTLCKYLISSLLVLFGVAYFGATISSTTLLQHDPYIGIPSGFDFPADETVLERFRLSQNVTEMRRHAWHVWAGLSQRSPSGTPIWETWYDVSEVFKKDDKSDMIRSVVRKFVSPRQLDVVSKDDSFLRARPLLSSILFNDSAKIEIRETQGLHKRESLVSLRKNDISSIGTFEKNAVALKLAWWLVKKDEMTAMPVWDLESVSEPSSKHTIDRWKRVVAIDPSRHTVSIDEVVNIEYLGVERENSRVVSLQDFYYFKFENPDEINSANSVLGTGVIFNGDKGKIVEEGDYAVLVAFHLATSEIDDWVWATFWWHDRPGDGPFGMDRPDVVCGVWRNYLMDTTYDFVTPREYDGTSNVCFNPWLESSLEGGVESNCMACHQYASWPDNPSAIELEPGQRRRAEIVRGVADDSFFSNRTKTHFLWSIVIENWPSPAGSAKPDPD